MPAKSKQQQKFFGVVKAMQAGDLPKKGAAGKVAKDMSKKEVDKYASTKHKGLPKKVKKETMKISDIKKMVEEELKYVLENLNDPILKKLRTLPKGNLLPPLNKWWEAQPEDLLSAIYWSKGQLPPREPAKFEKAYNEIVKQLHIKYPIPAELLDTIDVDDETERALSVDAPDMMEAKMTPAKVQKAQRELVATIDLLKKNFPMYKAAKESGDDKKLAKHRDIAIKLTKKKKQLEKALDAALGGLYQDAELELKEATLPKFKTPYEAYSWIMNKRGEAMDIEDEMRETSAEIQQLYGEMEQEAEPAGGPIADRFGKEIDALEEKHRNLRAEFDQIMAEIDEYDQNY